MPGLGIDAAVVDPRGDNLDRAGRGEDLAGLVGAVADHEPPAVLVALLSVAGDVVIDLGLQRLGQHPAGAFADQVVDQRAAAPAGFIGVSSSRNYGEHGSYPSGRR